MERKESLAVDIAWSRESLTVTLDDGRSVSVPLAWFPRLLAATRQQRSDWTLIGGGIGIHWEAIDEDISVASLLQPERCVRFVEATPLSPKNAPLKRAKSRTRRFRGSSRPS